MDSITHIVIGACTGEALQGKKLGKRALLWGAFAQSLADLDFLAALWSGPADNLLAHRGFTHSFVFLLLIVPLLSLLAERWHRPRDIGLRSWMIFFALQGLVHLGIDSLNVYGVGWWEPFTHARISFNWIFVADPFLSLWPGIAFAALLVLRNHDRRRAAWLRFGLGMALVYVLYCGLNKMKIDREVRGLLARQEIRYDRYFTTPTPLNNWLWFLVAGTDSGYYIGYRSVFDRKPVLDLRFVPRNDSLLAPVHDHEALQKLKRFSKGYYTVQRQGDTLLFSDMRFGQQIGWSDLQAPFVFNYYLQPGADNSLVVQRGRFAGWNREAFWSLVRRIGGE